MNKEDQQDHSLEDQQDHSLEDQQDHFPCSNLSDSSISSDDRVDDATQNAMSYHSTEIGAILPGPNLSESSTEDDSNKPKTDTRVDAKVAFARQRPRKTENKELKELKELSKLKNYLELAGKLLHSNS